MPQFYVTAILVTVMLACLQMTAASNATFPYGCSHAAGVYHCDYRFALPMSAQSFSPPPQQLNIYNVDGLLDATLLEEFNLVNTSQFDSNYDASLTITCIQGGGELELDSTSFTYMSFYQSLHIANCVIKNIPTSGLVAMGDLNYLGITGGIIESADANALAGVTVTKDSNSINPLGELEISNVAFTGGSFDASLLVPQNDISVLTLSNVQINLIDLTFLDGKTQLTTLNLDNNNFTSIPDGLFTGLKALSTLSMAGISWDCSCANLWWMTYAADNGIRIVSESLCEQPINYQGQRAASYHEAVCSLAFSCDGGSMPAMNLANVTCVTYLQLFIYILAVLAFIGLSLLLTCYIKTRRQIARSGAGGRRLSGNRIQQARQNPPGIKGGWS